VCVCVIGVERFKKDLGGKNKKIIFKNAAHSDANKMFTF